MSEDDRKRVASYENEIDARTLIPMSDVAFMFEAWSAKARIVFFEEFSERYCIECGAKQPRRPDRCQCRNPEERR